MKPSGLKAVKGTLRKGRENHREPVPAVGRPVAPDWLTGDALVEFNHIADLLEPLEYLTRADGGVLTAYALAWAQLAAAGRGERELTAAMLTTFRQLAGVLGLEPVSRGRISVPAKEKDCSQFDAFLGVGR